jgi:hypothetical protein
MGATARASNNNANQPSAKKNYDVIRYGNNLGAIQFGSIDKPGHVKSAVLLETADPDHQLSLDFDGDRQGWTSITSPGCFNVKCGSRPDIEKSTDKAAINSMLLEAENGDITIKANNGKIRLEARDIEIISRQNKSNPGNIKLDASDTISLDSRKVFFNAKVLCKICSPQQVDICANGVLRLYGSMIRGCSDASAVKDSKQGMKNFVLQQQIKEGG